LKSNVSIANHPLHPILVLIPAGAWITSLVLDIIFLATGNTFWFVASMWVMVVGIGGALLAAVVGFYDLFTLPMTAEPKRTGLWHMTLNLIITVLYAINVLVVRAPVMTSTTSASVFAGGTVAWAFVLNVVAIVLLLVSGWLGGELIYRYGMAVPRETIERAPRYEAERTSGRTGLAGSLGGESPSDRQE
jgi:uncharacterized membrane protein